MLKFKLQYILFELETGEFDLEIDKFVEHIFMDLQDALTHWDYNHIKHIVSFFVDVTKKYPNYVEKCYMYAEKVEGIIDVS